jgi:nitric oxide reductase large subunit
VLSLAGGLPQPAGHRWGHGAYVAPDWSADWLHREAMHIADAWAREQHRRPYAELADDQRAALSAGPGAASSVQRRRRPFPS